MKGSDLKLADSLWLLVMFGLSHGIHEWLQLYPLLEGGNLSFDQIYATKVMAVALLVLSYFVLVWFGLSLVRVVIKKKSLLLEALPFVLFAAWLLYLWDTGFGTDLGSLRMMSVGARNTFGLFGGLLTAYGLIAYSREIRSLNRTAAMNLFYAGVAFGFYAIFAGIFSTNFDLFRLPVPVEMLRGITAIFITYFIIKTLNIFDIETRRKIEQQARRILQAEKLTSLGQLAAGIAHEINNPLTNASLGVQRLAGLLKNENINPAMLEKLHNVEKNIDRASAIARELLQFSRQQEGEFIPVNVNTVLRGALTLLQYKLKSVTMQHELSPVPAVMGDPGKLEQVFINILSNATESMPDGGSIRISTRSHGKDVVVAIEDTGSGISQEQISRVFDPFFTTKEIGAGTGLGLSICYGIVRQHLGTIDLSSTAGKGTTVTIRLPGKDGA
jgi:signal transduction histidine kinase